MQYQAAHSLCIVLLAIPAVLLLEWCGEDGAQCHELCRPSPRHHTAGSRISSHSGGLRGSPLHRPLQCEPAWTLACGLAQTALLLGLAVAWLGAQTAQGGLVCGLQGVQLVWEPRTGLAYLPPVRGLHLADYGMSSSCCRQPCNGPDTDQQLQLTSISAHNQP